MRVLYTMAPYWSGTRDSNSAYALLGPPVYKTLALIPNELVPDKTRGSSVGKHPPGLNPSAIRIALAASKT